MRRKRVLLSIALILAGFLIVPAQNRITMPEQLKRQNARFGYPDFEKLKLPTPKKTESDRDWWKPDTVYCFGTLIATNDKFIFRYNSQGLVEEMEYFEQFREDDSWVNRSFVRYTYNSNNNLLTELRQSRDNNSWVNSALTGYTYDSGNNILTCLEQIWKGNSWVNSALTGYTYDSENNMLTRLHEYGESSSLETYTYDSNNNLLTELQQNRDNGSWINISQIIYTYDSNNNMLTMVRQYWQDDSWINISKIIYTYDSNNNMLTWLQQGGENSSWKNLWLNTYTYDSNNNIQTHLLQSEDNNLWINVYQNIYTCDSNNNILIVLKQNWANNSWVNSEQTAYTYDSNNNLLTKQQQSLDNNSWITLEQYLMTYDENMNGTSAEYWRWKDGSLQPMVNYNADLTLNYNNMQSNIGRYECHKIIASYVKVSGNDTGTEEVKAALPVEIYSAGKTIQINNRTGKNAVVTVYRIDGVKVMEQTMTGQATSLEIPVGGFYAVSVKAGNEKPVTAKLIVK